MVNRAACFALAWSCPNDEDLSSGRSGAPFAGVCLALVIACGLLRRPQVPWEQIEVAGAVLEEAPDYSPGSAAAGAAPLAGAGKPDTAVPNGPPASVINTFIK